VPDASNRLADLRTLRYANLDGAFASAFATLLGGTFFVKFIQELNPKGIDLWIGLMTSLPSLLGLLQIPGAIWGRANPSYKSHVTPGGWAWRLLHFPIVFLPLLALSVDVRLAILIGCLGLAYTCVHLVGPIYNDWLAELIPSESRGWFFSRRNMMLTAFSAGAALMGGLIYDGFRKAGHSNIGLSVVFGLGFVFAVVSMLYYGKMQDRIRPNPVRVSVRESLRALRTPMRDRGFRSLLIFFTILFFGQAFGGNLFGAFALESLQMPLTVLQLCAVGHAIGNLLTGKFWGLLLDKYGNKPIMGILIVGLFFTPGMWLFCQPGAQVMNATILILGHVFTGAIWAGMATCQFNLLLVNAPDAERANYLGLGLALQAIVGALSPMVGSALMNGLREGGMDVEQAYKVVFAVTMAARISALLFLKPVREAGALSIRKTLSQLRRVSPVGFATMMKLTKDGDVGARTSALNKLGEMSLEFASDEAVKALHDPNPRVRRQAARSLARMGGDQAVDALAHQLNEHPALVEEEVVDALGSLGDPSAVPALVPYLGSLRAGMRRATARALGRIGGEAAHAALQVAAGPGSDPDLRRSALQALNEMEAADCGALFAQALSDRHPSVRIAAAEGVSELHLAEAAPALRQALQEFDDEASAEAAYALSVVGDRSDLPLILRAAQASTSIITRRRCLLGLARFWGVEEKVYRLFLLEGIARDAAFVQMMQPVSKRSQRLRRALDLYSSGKEREALAALGASQRTPDLALFAEAPVEESFLVAACAYVRVAEQGS